MALEGGGRVGVGVRSCGAQRLGTSHIAHTVNSKEILSWGCAWHFQIERQRGKERERVCVCEREVMFKVVAPYIRTYMHNVTHTHARIHPYTLTYESVLKLVNKQDAKFSLTKDASSGNERSPSILVW